MNYYETLGVPKNASQDELKKAYKKASMQHHPDRTGGDDSKFKQINEAYSTLKDPNKRQQYDNPQQQQFAQGFGNNGFQGMGGFEDLFANFGFNMQGQRQQQRNPDITIAARVTLEEAYTGKTMIASYRLRTGKEEVVEIKVPPGAGNGNTIRYEGFGEEGMAGPRGSLHVKIQVVPHKTFAVDGINLHCIRNANIFDFIIGGSILIDTLDGGKVKVNIPAGTAPGTKFSIHGYGMPDLRSGRKGNLYVTVGGVVPKNLSQDQIITLQKMRKRLDKKGVD
jgi:curved DNA-binding protein